MLQKRLRKANFNMNAMPSIFRLAKNVSKHSNYKIRMGAVLVRKGSPISVGFNRPYPHPQFKWGIHAEVDALRTSGKTELKNSTMYVYRETADGSPAMARPCADCMNALTKFGVSTIIYSISEAPFYRLEKI